MAVLDKLFRASRAWRGSLSYSKSMVPSSHPRARELRRCFYHGTFEQQSNSKVNQVLRSCSTLNDSPCFSMAPAFLGALFSFGAIGVAYAESDEANDKSPTVPIDSPPNYVDIAKKERARIEELIQSKGTQYGSYPRFNVAVRGQKVTLKFQVPSTCEVAQLISNIGSQLGVKVSDRTGGSDMLLRAWDNPVAWQISLRSVENKKKLEESEDDSDDDLCILIFGSLITSDKVEVEFIKKGSLTTEELEAFVSALRVAGTKAGQNKGGGSRGSVREPSTDKSISQLESMGVRIYGVNKPLGDDSVDEISWDNIAGYDQQKREIEDTILMALHSPEVYDDIVRGTRSKFESNRPRAVLFEGPPGTGKTSCARVIANQAGIPLLYVPLEAVMSKYYGESERLLGAVFSQANELSDGAIIFLDEIDAFAISRDSEMHEATRRVLSVLLRQIDGFEQDKKVVVIAATNRKQDLDPALISRFDSMILFDLPDLQTRQEIIAQYAKQLSKPELLQLAQATETMSGRDIRDVCQGAERTWASKLIRRAKAGGEEQKITLPPIQEYLDSAEARRKALLSITEQKRSAARSKKPLLDFE
ncbi:PREDICTED: 26S protease regulatory subunit 7-like isoform X1 [Camelina sativa]|uniref:26S protease regulatory subunit 7-like isoform X1 n=1 Tax=Camelina sativa TaxID=90675 RepID=A0ABM1RGN5_CAMSA|nr:PREDICTED: 26S protease regulatory subunit 7-like isoform X1 [Camelina sativa]